MPTTTAGTLGELINTPLKGYEIRLLFTLQLSHGLMATFPALIPKRKNIPMVFGDYEVCERVLNALPRKKADVTPCHFLVNMSGEREAFSLHRLESLDRSSIDERGPLFYLDMNQVEIDLAESEHPYAWAPGCLSLVNFSDTDFKRQLEEIRRKMKRFVR